MDRVWARLSAPVRATGSGWTSETPTARGSKLMMELGSAAQQHCMYHVCMHLCAHYTDPSTWRITIREL
jgi:hypothetical protein